MEEQTTWVVVSLGGSLVIPQEEPDVALLNTFSKIVTELVAAGKRFVIVTGGGRTARKYQAAARSLGRVKEEDEDWLGIHATRLNAQLVRTALHDVAAERVITDPLQDELDLHAKVVVAAGWRPGRSTDYVAALLAERVGATRVVNLTDTSHVYDKDPRSHPEARTYDSLSWKAYLDIVGTTWSPGLQAPFDPVAAAYCREEGLSAAVLNTSDWENVRRALNGESFNGTLLAE